MIDDDSRQRKACQVVAKVSCEWRVEQFYENTIYVHQIVDIVENVAVYKR